MPSIRHDEGTASPSPAFFPAPGVEMRRKVPCPTLSHGVQNLLADSVGGFRRRIATPLQSKRPVRKADTLRTARRLPGSVLRR